MIIIPRRRFILGASAGFVAPAILRRLAFAQVGPIPGLGPGLLLAPGAPVVPIGTPTSLGTNQSSSIGNVSSLTMTTTANLLAGNLAVVGVTETTFNSITITGVSDGTNTYTEAKSTGLYGTYTETSLWYCANAQAVSSGATITATFSGTAGSGTNIGAMAAAQVSGIISSPLDRTAAASTTSAATVTATTSTLAKSNEIAFGYSAGLNSSVPTYSGASNFTNLSQTTDGSSTRTALDYDSVAATTAVSFAPAYSAASFRMGGVVATFKGN